jgi:hypothetical protein
MHDTGIDARKRRRNGKASKDYGSREKGKKEYAIFAYSSPKESIVSFAGMIL